MDDLIDGKNISIKMVQQEFSLWVEFIKVRQTFDWK